MLYFFYAVSPPLCEFIDYLDLEQSPEGIAEVERIAQEARER